MSQQHLLDLGVETRHASSFDIVVSAVDARVGRESCPNGSGLASRTPGTLENFAAWARHNVLCQRYIHQLRRAYIQGLQEEHNEIHRQSVIGTRLGRSR